MEVSLAARTEVWKAQLWASKLEQLKSRNDALADGLESALRRLGRTEDNMQQALLKAELAQVRAAGVPHAQLQKYVMGRACRLQCCILF